MSSKFIHAVAYFRMPFIFKAEQYSAVCIYHILLIYLSINGHVGCCYILAIVNNTAVKYLLKTLLSVILGIYPEMELLDHMYILLSTFGGPVIQFSTVTFPFYISHCSVYGFQLQIIAILMGCISLYFWFSCP